MSPNTVTGSAIDEILARMDRNIDRCTLEQSRLRYFAVLYRGVTARVGEGIQSGEFEDPARMQRLVVVFANRYLDALAQFWGGGRPTPGAERRSRSASARRGGSWASRSRSCAFGRAVT